MEYNGLADDESLLSQALDEPSAPEEKERSVKRDSSSKEGSGDDTVEDTVEDTEEKTGSDPDPEDEPEPEPESEPEPEPSEDEVLNGRPTVRDLKEKYPGIFKKVPELRGVIFREQQFARIFPTPAIAQTASEDSIAFQGIRESLINGDSREFISAMKGANGIPQMSANLLPALKDIDPDAYLDAIAPVLQTLVRSFYNSGVTSKDENVTNAALFLSEFVFSNSEVATGQRSGFDEVKLAADKAVREERARYGTERLQTYRADVQTSAFKELDSLITRSLDKEKDLTPFVKGAAKSAISAEVAAQLKADKQHLRHMDALWATAERGMSPADKASIITAYLARARQVIISAKNKVLSESRGPQALPQPQQPQQVAPRQQGRPVSQSNGPIDSKRIDWRKTTDADILGDSVTYK